MFLIGFIVVVNQIALAQISRSLCSQKKNNHNISCLSLSKFYGLLQPCDVTGAHRIISIAGEAQKTKHSEIERNIMACLAIFSPAFSTERLSNFKTLRLNTYIIQRIRFLDHNFFGI